MTYIFLDTMIYLHYTWFEDVDWQGVAGDQDVQIVVPHITLDELDTHKDNHKSPKIRERARKVANRLFDCITQQDGALKGALTASEFDESASFDFTAHNLDNSKNDHRLLAAILEFKESHPESVVLITQDIGPRLKANRLHIDARALPKSYRLPSEEDPLVKENKQLKNKLVKIQSAAPKLSLGFAEMDGNNRELTVTPSANVVDVDQQLEQIRAKYPPKGNLPHSASGSAEDQMTQHSASGVAGMLQVSESEYKRYNSAREKYFKQCKPYLMELRRFQLQCRIKLNLVVLNDGGAPAEDVDVYMHFPDGFELYTENDLPVGPEAPYPPAAPLSYIQQMPCQLRFNSDGAFVQPHIQDFTIPGPPDHFSLKKTNSYEVRDEFDRIKHLQAGVIQPLVVVFDTYESAASFQITYRISAANLPEPVEGNVNMVVKKGKGE